MRDIPEEFTDSDKKSFLEISNRCRSEYASEYSIVSLGLLTYLRHAAISASSNA